MSLFHGAHRSTYFEAENLTTYDLRLIYVHISKTIYSLSCFDHHYNMMRFVFVYRSYGFNASLWLWFSFSFCCSRHIYECRCVKVLKKTTNQFHFQGRSKKKIISLLSENKPMSDVLFSLVVIWCIHCILKQWTSYIHTTGQ